MAEIGRWCKGAWGEIVIAWAIALFPLAVIMLLAWATE